MQFGMRLRDLRVRRGMTQEELARVVGVAASSGVLSGWENGRTKPDYVNIQHLVVALQTNADYLLGFSDDPDRAVTPLP